MYISWDKYALSRDMVHTRSPIFQQVSWWRGSRGLSRVPAPERKEGRKESEGRNQGRKEPRNERMKEERKIKEDEGRKG
jgi:hypothetical protein